MYCGGVRDGNELKAFIPGGASAPWFFEEHLDLPLEAGAVGKAGSMLGSGAIVVMDEDTDIVKRLPSHRAVLRQESCGKCTPCREGRPGSSRSSRASSTAQGAPEDVDMLLDVCDNISPRHRLAAAPDDDLPARPVGRPRRSRRR